MKICVLLPSHFPPDIRVEKEARSLIADSHEIYLICMGREDRLTRESFENINVHRLPFRGKLDLLARVSAYSINPLWRKNWINGIEEIIKNEGIEILHVHDLPLVPISISIGKKYKIPIIFDMHENFPEALRVWREGKSILGYTYDLVFDSVFLYKIIEQRCVKSVNHIIVVVKEQKDRLIKLGVPDDKITVVMNTEDLEVFDNVEIISLDYRDNFVISYVGGFGQHRGIDAAIKAMPKILDKIPNAILLLVGGKGSGKYEEELKKLCKNLKVENNVAFTGWVDFNYVPSYIALSDVGLVPHYASGHTNTTIPHKIFQYMAMKKPVIVTDAKPLKRIVEETKCGIVVPSGDYNKMAEAIIGLHEDKKWARKLGKNGRRAVEVKYNWEEEAKKLISLYEELSCK